jgi:hypothetical protein
METVTFEIHHLITFKMDMVEFPELSSPKKWIQKGIDLLKKHAPRVLAYLSKQRVMAQLKDHKIIIKVTPKRRKKKIRKKRRKKSFTAFERRRRWTKRMFKVWVQKERGKRLILVILEGLVIPFTPVLALLPGPNVFFYIPALLLYYHFTSFLGLSKVDVDELDLEIKHDES